MVSKAGFQNYVQTGIIITINASAHADVALKVGAVTETVTVSGENTSLTMTMGRSKGASTRKP
jgi:hypothetical protein